jgi:succinyl-diaminopimelate desuccinylase
MAPPSDRPPVTTLDPMAVSEATVAVGQALDAGDLLQLTAELIDIPSESHHEAAITDVIEATLRARAPQLALERVGCNLVARTDLGRAQRVVIAGHTDTVPVVGNVPSHVDGSVVRGCGASDMKSGLAVMLALAGALPEPAVDVTWVFYEAEEIASEFNGLGRLFRERPDLVTGDVALLGEPTDGSIEAGCQGTLRLRVVLRGRRAHTARPWMGRNAIHRLAGLLARLESYEGRRPVIDGCEFRESLQAVRIEGGVAGNVVPDEVTLVLNHRFAPDRDLGQAEDHVRSVLAPALEPDDDVELVDSANAAAPSLGHPVIASLIERNHLEVRAKLGWTDVARFSAHDVPAANFGPGDATLAHRADEWVDRARLERAYAALGDLLQRGPD